MHRRIGVISTSLLLFVNLGALGDEPSTAERLERVAAIHGGAGPWAVVGDRIGERALKDLKLPRQSFSLLVVHHAPAEVQYSCIADGLQAATGASAGKLNLKVEEAKLDDLRTVIEDRKTGRVLTFTLRPEFAKSILDVPHDHFPDAARRVATLPDDEIFQVVETRKAAPAVKK